MSSPRILITENLDCYTPKISLQDERLSQNNKLEDPWKRSAESCGFPTQTYQSTSLVNVSTKKPSLKTSILWMQCWYQILDQMVEDERRRSLTLYGNTGTEQFILTFAI